MKILRKLVNATKSLQSLMLFLCKLKWNSIDFTNQSLFAGLGEYYYMKGGIKPFVALEGAARSLIKVGLKTTGLKIEENLEWCDVRQK